MQTLIKKCYEVYSRTFTDLTNCGVSLNETVQTKSCSRPCARHIQLDFKWKTTPWGQVRNDI